MIPFWHFAAGVFSLILLGALCLPRFYFTDPVVVVAAKTIIQKYRRDAP